jgi:hypothetical protein
MVVGWCLEGPLLVIECTTNANGVPRNGDRVGRNAPSMGAASFVVVRSWHFHGATVLPEFRHTVHIGFAFVSAHFVTCVAVRRSAVFGMDKIERASGGLGAALLNCLQTGVERERLRASAIQVARWAPGGRRASMPIGSRTM